MKRNEDIRPIFLFLRAPFFFRRYIAFASTLITTASTRKNILPFVLEVLINNILHFLARFSLLCDKRSVAPLDCSRANRPAWKKIYTTKLLRAPFRTEGDRSHVLRGGERLPATPSRNSRSLRIPLRPRCSGNDLACYREPATLENLPRHRSTLTASPVLSFVSSSSSFSSKGDQLRVTCASAGRTRS